MGNIVSELFYNNCQNLNLQNIVDINDTVRCATNLKGQGASSPTSSDLLLFDFPDTSPLGPTNYNGEVIYGGFQKIFISNIEKLYNPELFQRSSLNKLEITRALYYEYYVYIEKVKNLLDKNVNPHYVKILGGVRDTSFDNLFNFVRDKQSFPKITDDQLRLNFTDNLIKMCRSLKNRESLTKDTKSSFINDPIYYESSGLQTPLYENIYTNILPKARYGFILTERVKLMNNVVNFNQFNKLEIGESIFFKDFMVVFNNTLRLDTTQSNKQTVTRLLYMFLFQIVSACYALSLSGVNHNDLHNGNIIIKRIESRKNEYNIDGKKFTIYTNYTAMIYDFDRAICENYDNKLNRLIFKPINLLNNINDRKDIIKVFFTIYHTLSVIPIANRNRIDEEILEVITPEGEEIDTIKNYFKKYPSNIEGEITSEHLNYFDNVNNILDKLYNSFESSNITLLNNNPNIQIYIYMCNRDAFRNYNLIMPKNLEILKNTYENDCSNSKLLLNKNINQLTLQNKNFQNQIQKLNQNILELQQQRSE